MRQVVRYVCSECNFEHHSPTRAEQCEENDRERKAAIKASRKEEQKWHDKGHDVWHERSGMKHALRIDPGKFGNHDFGEHDGTQDCSYGCGCWMGAASSGGPVNPFGACPKNPLPSPNG